MADAENDESLHSWFEKAFGFIKFHFDIDSLYEDQIKLIKAFYDHKNIFFNAPKGYGKSIVFQLLPWVLGIVQEQNIGFSTLIVISPLKSMIEDQCMCKWEVGVSCIALCGQNSFSDPAQQDKFYYDDDDGSDGTKDICRNVREGDYSLVYATPECMLGKNSWRKILSSEELGDHCIGVVYDEALMIAQWGSDENGKKPFRRFYGELHEFNCLLSSETRIGLFTATATKQTKLKVLGMLGIDPSDTFCIEKSPDMKNKVEELDVMVNLALAGSSIMQCCSEELITKWYHISKKKIAGEIVS
eukprot:gene14495-16002_t